MESCTVTDDHFLLEPDSCRISYFFLQEMFRLKSNQKIRFTKLDFTRIHHDLYLLFSLPDLTRLRFLYGFGNPLFADLTRFSSILPRQIWIKILHWSGNFILSETNPIRVRSFPISFFVGSDYFFSAVFSTS